MQGRRAEDAAARRVIAGREPGERCRLHHYTRADVWEGHGCRGRGRMGQRPRGDPFPRAPRAARAGSRSPALCARPPLALRRGAHRAGAARRRGGLHRGTAGDRDGDRRRPPHLPDPRRAPQRDRSPRRHARRALPLSVPELGRAGEDPEQAPSARDRRGRGRRDPAHPLPGLGRRGSCCRRGGRFPADRQAVRQRRLPAQPQAPALPLRDARRARPRVRARGAARADGAGADPVGAGGDVDARQLPRP